MTKIIGGWNTTINHYPWQVSLLNASNGENVCGGALIGRYTVLTTASCVRENRINQTRIGSTNRQRGGYLRTIRRTIIHPNYDQNTNNNDIAILTLRRRVYYSRSIRSIELPFRNGNLADNVTLTVTGWGQLANRTLPLVLQAVNVTTINQRTCANQYRQLTENMFCAGNFNQGGVGPCLVSAFIHAVFICFD